MRIKLIALLVLFATAAFPCSMDYQKAVFKKRLDSSSALFRFERRGKAGFIDANGKVVIRPKFEPDWWAREDFVEGLAPAQKKHFNWGFINESGEWIVQPQYYSVDPFSEGLAAVTSFNQHTSYQMAFVVSYIDRNGVEVIKLPPTVGDAGEFSEGLAFVREKGRTSAGRVGFIDRSGEVVIPLQFAEAGEFHESLARVVLDGQCYVTAPDGHQWPPPSVKPESSCGFVPADIIAACQEGFIDKTGNLRFEFEKAQDFSEGMAGVAVRGKWGYIDPQGNFAIPPRFDEALPFSEGLAAVRIGSHWGFIDHEGVEKIPLKFSRASSFSDGLAKVAGGYIDKQGSLVIEGWPDGTDFVKGLAHVSLGRQLFGYIGKSGKVIFQYTDPDHDKPSRWPFR